MYVYKSPHKEHNRSVVTMRSNSILIMFIVAAVQEACEVNASSMFIPWLGDLVVEAQESTQAQATASGTASHSNSGTSDKTQVSMTKGSSRISDSAADANKTNRLGWFTVLNGKGIDTIPSIE